MKMEDIATEMEMDSIKRVSNQICALLKSRGMRFETSWLFEQPELGIENGVSVLIDHSEVVFRLIDEETLLIVLYRKEKQYRNSLRFSLNELFWFFELIAENVPDVHYATGLVDVYPYRIDKGIDTDRLAKLYKRCGADVYTSGGRMWAKLDIRSLGGGKKNAIA